MRYPQVQKLNHILTDWESTQGGERKNIMERGKRIGGRLDNTIRESLLVRVCVAGRLALEEIKIEDN